MAKYDKALYEAPLQMLCDSPTLYRRNRDAEDYVRRTLEVDGGDEIEIRLAPGGGGWTGRFSR